MCDDDVTTGCAHLAREVRYRSHDGLCSVVADPNEKAIDAAVRAEVDRDDSIDDMTYNQSAGGFDGSSVWQVEGWKNCRSVYKASIYILYETVVE